MIDARPLIAIFADALPQLDGTLVTNDGTRRLASIDGAWRLTVDPDGVLIAEEDFDAIAGAAAHPDQDGSLLIAGGKAIVAAQVNEDTGARWILRVPG